MCLRRHHKRGGIDLYHNNLELRMMAQRQTILIVWHRAFQGGADVTSLPISIPLTCKALISARIQGNNSPYLPNIRYGDNDL